MAKRVFLVVLDSFGVGEEPDAASFGDYGVPLPRAAALTVLTCAHLDYSIWMGSIFSPPSLNLWELLAVFASALWERIQPSGTGSLRDWKAHLLSLLTLTDSHRRSSKNLNNAPAVPCCAINRIPVPKSSRTSARNTCVPAHSLYIHQQTPYFKSLRMRRSSQ